MNAAIMFYRFLLSVILMTGVESQEFILQKRDEIDLHRSVLNIEPYSKSFAYQPLFCRAGSGEFFFVEANKDAQGAVYFFAQNGKLRNMVKLNPCCAMSTQGAPGNVAGIQHIFVNRNNEYGTYDTGYRLSLWDTYGNLKYTTILSPYQLRHYYYLIPPVFDGRVLASGIYFFNPIKAVGTTQVALFDYENPGESKIFDLPGEACSLAFSKGGGEYTRIQVASLSSGKYACNVNLLSGIYIVSLDGKMLSNETIPQHFRSLADAESLGVRPFVIEDSAGRMSEDLERWISTWTHSYEAYEYGQNQLLVPRVLYPAFYLDLYSYSDDSITYNGYVSTRKPFLFADTSGIYLEEARDTEKVVVGKYAIVGPAYAEEMAAKRVEADKIATEVSGIRKVEPGKGEDCSKCSRKEKDYKGSKDNIRSLKLLSTDSASYVLLDSLAGDKDHIVLFISRMGLVTGAATSIAQEFFDANPELDLTIVMTHRYAAELEETIKVLRITQTDYRILANIDENRLKPFLKSPVSLVVVSRDGRIVKSADWPKFEIQSR